MTTYPSEKISRRASKKGRCPSCGSMVTRSKTFSDRADLFSLNDDGTVRSDEQVMAGLVEQADAWVPDFKHPGCP